LKANTERGRINEAIKKRKRKAIRMALPVKKPKKNYYYYW